ncbi:hypothetical protein P5673_008019 [Acropora cervicornis]|uniref:Uncharacterized protein n=1 Tax=Acropora cervicornis TaxID=6130 RepID=A0AAD9QVX1_ACRCE|nr:hypothetical protein P5673_008019 [Acropora cervicornis]
MHRYQPPIRQRTVEEIVLRIEGNPKNMTKVKFKDGHSVSQEPMLYFPFSMSRKVNLEK